MFFLNCLSRGFPFLCRVCQWARKKPSIAFPVVRQLARLVFISTIHFLHRFYLKQWEKVRQECGEKKKSLNSFSYGLTIHKGFHSLHHKTWKIKLETGEERPLPLAWELTSLILIKISKTMGEEKIRGFCYWNISIGRAVTNCKSNIYFLFNFSLKFQRIN